MNEETQKELLKLSKKALSIVSMHGGRKNRDFVFELRDLIRQIEKEIQDGRGRGSSGSDQEDVLHS